MFTLNSKIQIRVTVEQNEDGMYSAMLLVNGECERHCVDFTEESARKRMMDLLIHNGYTIGIRISEA